MTAGATLLFGEPLFLLALGATAVHFTLAQVVFKKQSTTRAILCARFGDVRFTPGERALKDSLAG